ncbi:tyrosine-type recombinase/integrase [Sphingobacterium lactis]|uniref:site-specific integrase n=1 Tax=Sphingobacterium lactis TaxID=797291 RepID=UPI003EC5ECBA
METYKHSISFNLVTKEIEIDKIKTKPIRINAILRFDNRKIVISGVEWIILQRYKINEKGGKITAVSDAWDFKKQFPKAIYTKQIKRLNEVKTIMSELFNKKCNELGSFPPPDEAKKLQSIIDSVLKNKQIQSKDTAVYKKTENLLVYIHDYILGAISSPITRYLKKGATEQPYKKRAIQSFLNTLNTFIDFKNGTPLTFKDILSGCERDKLPVIKFEDISNEFLVQFKRYLANKNLSINYYGSHLKYLKKFMKAALLEKYHVNMDWKDFSKGRVEVKNVALSTEQLQNLARYDFSDNPCYDNARDLFLVGCWTGLRYSDYSRLTMKNVSDGFIDILTKKTNEQVVVPILKEMKLVLEKYKNTETGFPRSISDVKLNKYIKEIGKIVGENSDKSFLEKQVVERELLSGKQIETIPMYERLSTHTGRRSFCTNAVLLKIPKHIIMQISGHRSEAAFNLYVGIKGRDYASLLAEHFAKEGL